MVIMDDRLEEMDKKIIIMDDRLEEMDKNIVIMADQLRNLEFQNSNLRSEQR